MPNRLARACRIGTCPHPASSRGRCAQHARPAEQARHRWAHIYRDSRWSGSWGLREQVLTLNPLCALCGALATCVDHIRPHRGDERLAYDVTNLRSLCTACHGRVTRAAQPWSRRR
jgi:5-methylcytosine-specific restriction enzyme A